MVVVVAVAVGLVLLLLLLLLASSSRSSINQLRTASLKPPATESGQEAVVRARHIRRQPEQRHRGAVVRGQEAANHAPPKAHHPPPIEGRHCSATKMDTE